MNGETVSGIWASKGCGPGGIRAMKRVAIMPTYDRYTSWEDDLWSKED